MAGITDLVHEITGGRRPRQNQVRVCDANFNPIFKNLGILDFEDNLHDRVMYHPLEDGSIIADHRVIEPLEIKLSCKLTNLDFQSVYFEILQAFANKDKLVVQSKVNSYENMYINALPTKQNADNYSGIDIQVSFQQALFTQPQYGITPKNPANSNTVPTGIKQGTPANDDQITKATASVSTLAPKVA